MSKLKKVFEEKVSNKEKMLNEILMNKREVKQFSYKHLVSVATVFIVILIGTYVYMNKNIKHEPEIIQNVDNNQNEFLDFTANISEKAIYQIDSNMGKASYAYDVLDTKTIYEHSDIVVTGTIIEKKLGIIKEGYSIPVTPTKIKIDKVIKGTYNGEIIDFTVLGGICTVQSYIDSDIPGKTDQTYKLGLDKLTDKEKKEEYIEIPHEFQKYFKVGKKYIVMIIKLDDGYCGPPSYAGFLDIENSDKINTKDDILNLINRK